MIFNNGISKSFRNLYLLMYEYILVMKFINRIAELNFLKEKISSLSAELLILYGRRRIGKTELIQQFLENNVEGMYFLSRLESQIDTLRRFNNQLAIYFADNTLITNPLTNWDQVFNYISKISVKTNVIVIDEFQYLIERNSEILSILQDYWDNKLRFTKIKLILLGSSISLMIKHTLDYSSPIYGRRTGQWRVEKLSPDHLFTFFPNYTMQDIIETYGVIDTIPGYLALFDSSQSVQENIKNKLFSKGEFLYEEPLILLREELRDPSNYVSILSAIAGGLNSFNELYQKSGLDKSILSKYLYTLEQLNIVERVFTIEESFKKKLKGKGQYKIKDNFIDFWFRFVYLNQQLLEINKTKEVIQILERDFSNFMGSKFEQFIFETLMTKPFFAFSQLGKWWQKDVEIDLIAQDEKTKNVTFIECKWQEQVDAKKIVQQLAKKAEYYSWNKSARKNNYILFAKSFKSKTIGKLNEETLLYDLKDLEELLKK